MFSKDKLNNFINFFIHYVFTYIIFILILVMCFILFATTSKAADPSYFPMLQNENDTIPQSHIDIFNSYLDVDNNFYFIYKGVQFSDGVGYYYVYLPKSYDNAGIYGELNSNGYQFSLYLIGSANLVNGRLDIADGGGIYNTVFYQPPFINFSNLNSSKYDSNISYVSNFKVFTNNTENADVVLKYGPDPVGPVDVGIAIIPPEPILPDFDNLTPPSKVPPTYTTSDYTWTTPPTFDGSSVEAALGSIQNVIGWLANNLKEEFKNITDNLEGFFKYIGETIQYYAGIIIDTLNNFMTNFYDNMKSLVQPIFEKLAYITEPIDTDVITSAFNDNALVSIQDDFTDFFNDFDDIIRNTPEPDTFDITINIQNVRTFYNLGCRSPVVLHLGNNLNGTTKNIFRAFLWVLVVVGSIFLTEKNLSVWIKGGGFGVK